MAEEEIPKGMFLNDLIDGNSNLTHVWHAFYTTDDKKPTVCGKAASFIQAWKRSYENQDYPPNFLLQQGLWSNNLQQQRSISRTDFSFNFKYKRLLLHGVSVNRKNGEYYKLVLMIKMLFNMQYTKKPTKNLTPYVDISK